jgi:hypothetical protein
MERRRLWRLSCPVKDALLWTSLDWREALAFAEASGAPLEYPAGLSRNHPHAVIAALHQRCHDPNPLAVRLDALLESLHEDAVRRVEESGVEEVASWLRRDLPDFPLPLPGLIWAVARDPRPRMRSVEAWLTWRTQVEGLRALAFGKVDVIEVSR